MNVTQPRYVPALRFRALTRLYDPLMELWTVAGQVRVCMIEVLQVASGMRLLELGCGPGRLAVAIKHTHPHVVVEAVDADPGMVALARRNAHDAGVEVSVVQGDIAHLPLRGPYDRVCSTLVFHHLLPERKRQALAEVRRVLAPGGRFVIPDFGVPRGAIQWATGTPP